MPSHTELLQDPLLDDLDVKTLITDDVNSESGSQIELQGMEIVDPTQEKQGTLVTQERPGIPGKGKVADTRTTSKPFV